MRHEELLTRALRVISDSINAGAHVLAPMFSSGHDSLCAVYAASRHSLFDGRVYHIRTGIGANASYQFAQDVAKEYGWTLLTFQSKSTYEHFIRERGFPGPGMHQWAYVRLKERCVRMICNQHTYDKPIKSGRNRGGLRQAKLNVALITGCRKHESERRMGTVEPLKIGESSPKTGKVSNRYRYWVAPCHDWTTEDQMAFMDGFDLPRNPVKLTPIGMSGECFCGAFAKPGELDMIRRYVPDVAAEIDRLTVIAKECGKHANWGTRPDRQKGIVVAQTGPLCNSCDARAMLAGIVIDQRCK